MRVLRVRVYTMFERLESRKVLRQKVEPFLGIQAVRAKPDSLPVRVLFTLRSLLFLVCESTVCFPGDLPTNPA